MALQEQSVHLVSLTLTTGKGKPQPWKGLEQVVRKAGKKGGKYPPTAKKLDSKKPGQHLTKEEWMALTDKQKTASRDARRTVKEAKEAGSKVSAIRTIRTMTVDDNVVMEDADGVFDDSPSVAALKPAPKSALKNPPVKNPPVFHINMTQRGESKQVSYTKDDGKPAAKRKV
jgi:hypothetical protein